MNERTILDLDGYLLQGIVRLAQNAQRKGNRYTQLISDLRAQYFARAMRATCRYFANALAPTLVPAFVYRMCHLHLCDSPPRDGSSCDRRMACNDQIFATYMQLCAPIGTNPDARQFARKWRYHILYAFITMPIEFARVGERCARHWISEECHIFSRDEMIDLLPHMVSAIDKSLSPGITYQNRIVNIYSYMCDAWSHDGARDFVQPTLSKDFDMYVYNLIDLALELFRIPLRAERPRDEVDQLMFKSGICFTSIARFFDAIRKHYLANVTDYGLGKIDAAQYIRAAATMLIRAPTILRSYISAILLIQIAETEPKLVDLVIQESDINIFDPAFEPFRAYRQQQGHLYIPRFDSYPPGSVTELDYQRLCEMRAIVMYRDNLELLHNTSRANSRHYVQMIEHLREVPIPQFFANMLLKYSDTLVSYIDTRTWNPNEVIAPIYFEFNMAIAVRRLRIAIQLQRISLCINGIRKEQPLFILIDQDDLVSTVEAVLLCALKHPKTDRHLALRYCRALGRSLVADISAQYHAIPYADYYLQQLTQPIQP